MVVDESVLVGDSTVGTYVCTARATVTEKLVCLCGAGVSEKLILCKESDNLNCCGTCLRNRLGNILRSLAGAGEEKARQQMHQASTMAGMAFSQAGLGLCHAMAHALGGAFHIPHGRLNAILLPAVVSYNARFAGEKYARLAGQAGLGSSAQTLAVRNLKNGLIRLRRELNMPQTLSQAGVTPRQVRALETEILRATLADPCCATNPMPPQDHHVRRILNEVMGRG